MKKLILLPIIALILTGCNSSTSKKETFQSWNECDALTALKEYMKDVTDKNSEHYIPVEDRIATFDMDGTFVGELYPTYFEYNLLEYRVLEDENYKNKAPSDVVETAQDIRDFVRTGKALPKYDETHGFDMKHAYAAAKAYAGMSLKEFDDYVKEYAKKAANGFTNMTYGQSFYKPMLEVFNYLEENDFTYYVVSGSDRFICRALVDSLNIEPNRVIGMDVVLKSEEQGENDGVNYTIKTNETLYRTDELIIKNLKTNKVKQIAQEIGKVPVLSFGNSSGDEAMHNYCLSNQKYRHAAFMLVADDDERDHAKKFNEDETAFQKRIDGLYEKWENANYNVISMKNDFKTIYGENVTKTSFVF